MIGRIIEGRYEITTKLGDGGSSSVYLAKDLKLDKFWAIKYSMKDFKYETDILLRLDFHDLPRVVDKITDKTGNYIVMDYINGITLKNKVRLEGMQKEKDVIYWCFALCDILTYLHDNQNCPIIYRDLKPENIILTHIGRISLVDFGNATIFIKRNRTLDSFEGTKEYAAPEQYKDGSNLIDQRTDIYSLGATISFLLTKKVSRNIRKLNPLVSQETERIVNKCLEINPEERYQDANSLKVDLQKLSFLLS